MGELQRYRAHGGPIGPVARRFVEALADLDDAGISPAVLERLAMLAQAPGPLDDADQRWIRTQLPEIVRQLAGRGQTERCYDVPGHGNAPAQSAIFAISISISA